MNHSMRPWWLVGFAFAGDPTNPSRIHAGLRRDGIDASAARIAVRR
jgi:hypothetical protein